MFRAEKAEILKNIPRHDTKKILGMKLMCPTLKF